MTRAGSTQRSRLRANARRASLAVAVCALAGAVASHAQSVEQFYAGRQVSLYIGYSPGGGYDTYARVLARHIGKHIPGNPTVVPQNMPGAGSLTLANYLYNIAPKDGTAFGTFGRGLAMERLLGGNGVRFDSREFSWIGSLNNEVSLCVSWHTSDVTSVADLRSQEFIVGGTGSGSDTAVFPLVLRNLLGMNIRLISGYPGGNDVLLAMERGEIEGRCGWSWATVQAVRPEWVEEQRMNILMQLALEKHPDLPDVPLVMELARTEDERAAMELIFARQVMGRPYAAPPGVPADRLEALRRAFDATASDPEFVADAMQAGLELNPVSGERVDAVIARIHNAAPSAIRLATDAIRETD